MSLTGILLGIINIAIVVAILLLIGMLIVWFMSAIAKIEVPWNIQQMFLIIVGLIALYMLVALLLGLPTVRIIGGNFRAEAIAGAAIAALPTGTASYLHRLLA